MNLKNLTVAVFTLIATITTAQSTLNLGLKGGANYSGFHTDKSTFTDLFGINAGGIAEYQFTDMFGLQAEVLYNTKGGGFGSSNGNGIQTLSLDAKLNYLDIPLMAKFYIVKGISIDVGPQIGFLLSSKGTASDGDEEEEIELTDLNSTDFSINAGFTFNLGDRAILQARYSYGLTEVFNNQDYKNSVISVSLGYFFYKVDYR